MDISPVTPVIGAELSGVDLNASLSEETHDAIYQALLDHLVIFFRDQDIRPERHLAFAAGFGVLDEPHPSYPHVAGFEQVMKLANEGTDRPGTDEWHTDMTFKQDPPFASVLVAREVPACGGDTLWRNMYAAYDALPPEMKAQIEDLRAVHDMGSFRNTFAKDEATSDRLMEAMPRFGSSIHEVVKTHPVTGRKFLYVNESFTVHVLGLSARESRRLLTYLLDHCERPEFQVRFKWRPGSVAMWDNRCTQHYAMADYSDYRCMNRVTIVRDRRAEGTERKVEQLAV